MYLCQLIIIVFSEIWNK